MVVQDQRKTNVLLNLQKYQPSQVDKIYVCVKGPIGSMYQLLINRREQLETKKLKNPKALIGYSQACDNVYKIWKTLMQKIKEKFE